MTISKITNDLLDKVISEIKKKENITKIQLNIIDPIVQYTISKCYPYILAMSIIFSILLIFIIIILFLTVKINFK